MSALVFVNRDLQVVEPAVSDPGIRHRFTDWRGRVWDLSYSQGVYLGPNIRGLGMPKVTRFTDLSPAVHGSRWRGYVVDEREVFWPLRVHHPDRGSSFLARDAAFWNALHPEHTGRWDVVLPDGSYRSLDLRLVDDGNWAPESSPARVGLVTYGATLVAEAPMWYGQPILRSWKAPTNRYFFGGLTDGTAGAQLGPPFGIAASSGYGTALMPNPGDVESFVRWVIRGPLTAAQVGIVGHTITWNTTLTAGQSVTIDTDPEQLTEIRETGVDVTNLLVNPDWYGVPGGGDATLAVSTTGGGSVEATLVPRWFRYC